MTKRKRLFYFLQILYILVLCELAARGFWKIKYDASFFNGSNLIYAFYSELNDIRKLEISRKDRIFDILLLGGSVLHNDWTTIEKTFHESLFLKTRANLRIHNAAQVAHTTLDSATKYDLLKDKNFDLVIIYHGINDIRTDNCPPNMFQKDYSHYSYYKTISQIRSLNPITQISFLPITVVFLFSQCMEKTGITQYVPKHVPRQSWLEFGALHKSSQTFASNLQTILSTAEKRNEPVIMMTFASYIPDNYSLENFYKLQLDYNLHDSAIELWGLPGNVRTSIEKNNSSIRRLAKQNTDITFVDMAKIIPNGRVFYNDVCHLTHTGSELFVKNLVDATIPILNRKQGRY